MSTTLISRIKRYISGLTTGLFVPLQEKKISATLQAWYGEQNTLPMYYPVRNKLLLIRLDGTPDYLLWRNSLHIYKFCPTWKDYYITLLGNREWKDIFDYADNTSVDETIWVDKAAYAKPGYRRDLWERLRYEGFDKVICPSYTRMPLLDDACALATGSEQMFACSNSYFRCKSNKMSDAFYQYLYQPKSVKHDFLFNQNFANWCCHTGYTWQRPMIDGSLFQQPDASDYIICAIGSQNYKLLSASTWIEVLKSIRTRYPSHILLAYKSEDKAIAEQIGRTVPIQTIKASSAAEIINYCAFANAVITEDIATAHVSVSCQTPTLIVSNEANQARFTGYREVGIRIVETVYVKPFGFKEKAVSPVNEMVTDNRKVPVAENILCAFEKVYPTSIMNVIMGN